MKKTELDLHGVRHGDVQHLIDQFLFQQYKLRTSYITIITGKSDKMKEITTEVLEEYDLKPEEDFLNSGQLNVRL